MSNRGVASGNIQMAARVILNLSIDTNTFMQGNEFCTQCEHNVCKRDNKQIRD